MTDAISWILKRWPLFAAAASATVLTAAILSERVGGLNPCGLCLQQRDVYKVAIAVGVIGAVLQVSRPVIGRWPTKLAIAGLASIFLFGAGLAAYHAGVEWRWWEGPASCTSGGGGTLTLEDLNRSLAGGVRAPGCDEAPGYVLGLSMAGWNAIISLGLAIASLAALWRREPALTPEPALG